MMGDMMAAGVVPGGGGGGGSLELKATPLAGGFWVAHQDDLLKVFARAQRNNLVRR
jgi:hypothetical protein